MARRRWGQGAVYLRADGRWEGQLRLPDGNRKPVYEPTEMEVIDKLADAGWRAAQGLPLLYTQQTVRE